MYFEKLIASEISQALNTLFQQDIAASTLPLQKTRKEFEGDFTLVVFSFTAFTKLSPDKTGELIGQYLLENSSLFEKFNVIKGFLNLSLKQERWTSFFEEASREPGFGFQPVDNEASPTVLEYSSPNTNKPLHLGHVRNNLLGSSLAKILQANGQRVIQVNLVNDRGIHICKSMLAWRKWGNEETPLSTGMKSDHLVGKYYVLFDQHLKAEIEVLVAEGLDRDTAARQAPLLLEAQEVLRKWEDHDPETLRLWNMMNHLVYDGFAATYQRMGISFDQTFYESNTYLLGKEMVDYFAYRIKASQIRYDYLLRKAKESYTN